ncbi:thioredoxin family protein [Ehrlichia muris]|uniref:AhpC/TSA family protein n=1 Tax=Ehrlichia cf. muris str. EmCRT TaxID=1359167 RepID=A0A0F3NCE5_9RICK|nr:thioredoxin family protein [Ehrlichia muris]KJV65700.1 ahpC/TSA family protein [Ehrlichia cf. muris str. EmCRT]
MVALNTPPVNKKFIARDFLLKSIDGNLYNLGSCHKGSGLLIMFICNHCPYVKAIISNLVYDVNVLKNNYNIYSVAIMPNDTTTYPEDSYENMINFAQEHGIDFPYLIDENQVIARSYGAVCTPDFFGFNNKLELCYRGRFDASGRNQVNSKQEDRDLFNAMKFIAQTGKSPENQKPSIGCSIKWKSQDYKFVT